MDYNKIANARLWFANNINDVIILQSECLEMVLSKGVDNDTVTEILKKCEKAKEYVATNKKLKREYFDKDESFDVIDSILLDIEFRNQEEKINKIIEFLQDRLK